MQLYRERCVPKDLKLSSEVSECNSLPERAAPRAAPAPPVCPCAGATTCCPRHVIDTRCEPSSQEFVTLELHGVL